MFKQDASENNKEGNCALNKNKKAQAPTNCFCLLGRKTQSPGSEGEEQVSWMYGGERWEAEKSAGPLARCD